MTLPSRIIKYRLDPVSRQTIDVPAGSFVSHIHEQDGAATIWMIRPAGLLLLHTWQVTCVNTGQPIPDDAGRYLGTAHIHDGRTVVHVFIQEPQSC